MHYLIRYLQQNFHWSLKDTFMEAKQAKISKRTTALKMISACSFWFLIIPVDHLFTSLFRFFTLKCLDV